MRTSCVAAAAALLLTPLAAARVETARLAVVSTQPLVVRGTGFAPGEVVVVKVEGLRRLRSLLRRASALGTFRVTLGGTSRRGCRPVVVRATGSGGSRATLRWLPPCGGP